MPVSVTLRGMFCTSFEVAQHPHKTMIRRRDRPNAVARQASAARQGITPIIQSLVDVALPQRQGNPLLSLPDVRK